MTGKTSPINKVFMTARLSVPDVFHTEDRIYTFLNPVSYLEAVEHKELFDSFDGIFADGSVLVAGIKCLYGKSIARRSFDMTSLAPALFRFAQDQGKSVYIVASRQEEVEKAVGIFRQQWPGLYIVGYRNGYFASEAEVEAEISHIAALRPDFVIVGMGIVKQEQFLLKVKQARIGCIGFTCGGFIHQTAHDCIDYYPAWIDAMNLRFLYRMYREKHTRKRYIQAALLFPARFIYERFFG